MPEGLTPSGTENTGAPASGQPAAGTGSTGAPASGQPPASSAAPAAQAPARSATALDALKKASEAASSAASQQPNPDGNLGQPPASAKTQPDGQPKPGEGAQDDPTKDAAWMGIPEGRRNVILQNARKAEREAVLAEVNKELGWARGVDVNRVEAAVGISRNLASNPVQFAIDLIREINADPQLGPMLAQAMGGVQPGAQPGANGQPKGPIKPKLRAEDGTEAYSASQVMEILDNFKNELMGQITGTVQPMTEFMETQQEREQVISVIHEAREETAQLMKEMAQMPHFTENKLKIAEVLEKMDPRRKAQLGAVASLQLAYQIVLKDHVWPTIQQNAEEAVRKRQLEKANAASGNVQPNTTVPQSRPKKPTNPTELAAHMAAMAGQQQ